jgi:hypothetical protein
MEPPKLHSYWVFWSSQPRPDKDLLYRQAWNLRKKSAESRMVRTLDDPSLDNRDRHYCFMMDSEARTNNLVDSMGRKS